MDERPLALLPELLLFGGAVAALVVGLVVPQTQQAWARAFAAAAVLGSLVATVLALADPATTYFSGTFAVDDATGAARLVVGASTLLVLGLAAPALAGHPRETEAYVFLLVGAAGAQVMAGTTDLLVLAVGYLMASVPLYPLVAHPRTSRALEAGLKTYLLGSLLGVVMLLGAVLLFGVAGGTSYAALAEGLPDAPAPVVAAGLVALLAGLTFKSGAVPGHFWVPDAAQASLPAVAAFVTTVPKVGGLVATLRVLTTTTPGDPVDWPLLVAVLAALSMTLGNLAAFRQTDVRRLLGWSTVSQAGYLLVAVAAAGRSDLGTPALLYFVAAYAVTNLAAFAVVAALPRAVAVGDWAGLWSRHRWLALSLVLALLGLVGTPPTAGFVGKLEMFAAAVDSGLTWLAALAVVNTVASVFYYLRWVAPTFGEPSPDGPLDARPLRWPAVAAVTGAGATLVLGVLAGPALALLEGPLAR